MVGADQAAEGGVKTGVSHRHEAVVGMLTRGTGVTDKFPGLPTLLESVAKRVAAELSAIMATPSEVRLGSLETGAVRDVAALEMRGCLAAMLSLDAWGKVVSALAEHDCVFTFVELLCGGDGAEPRFSGERELTTIEKRLAGLLFEKVAMGLASALTGVAKTEVHVRTVGEMGALEALGQAAAPVVLAAFELSVIGRRGRFVLAMPEAALEPVRKQLALAAEARSSPRDPTWAAELEKGVTKAGVLLTAVLDELTLELGDLARLQPGRILELKATPERPVKLEAEGQPLLKCQLGKAKGAYTLRVEGFVDREEEFLNTLIFG